MDMVSMEDVIQNTISFTYLEKEKEMDIVSMEDVIQNTISLTG